MDTDSFLLEFKKVELHEEMKSGGLKDLMYLNNFPEDHDFYHNSRKDQLVLLKSETGCSAIKKVSCMAPKAYVILLMNGSTKNTAKGVNHNQKIKLRHDTHREVHKKVLWPFDNLLHTVTTEKVALAKI